MLFVGMSSTQAQVTKMFKMEKDSIPLFCGFSVSFDLVGPAMMMLTTHGEYEGALRVNLHDQWFPIFELGLGRANHKNDEITGLTYKTTAPYFRLGMDWNILRKKHQPNRMYAGFRYAFTSYNVDIIRENLPDPVWKTVTGFGVEGSRCNMHWMEIVLGIDSKVFGNQNLLYMLPGPGSSLKPITYAAVTSQVSAQIINWSSLRLHARRPAARLEDHRPGP